VSALEALDAAGPVLGAAAPPESLAQGLYERHSQRIFGFCVRRLATREEAEDAVQTTFLYALRALQRGVVPVSETAWLFKIAENVCLAAHRSNGRRRARELADPPELVDPASDREDSRDAGRELVRALGTITENQRKALLLREWRGLSYREISVQLGVSVGAVETLIFRARKGVAKALSGATTVRGRVAGIFDLGVVFNTLKSAFGGSATVGKLAATAAVVTIAALPAGDSAPGSAARTVQPSSAVAPPVSLETPDSAPAASRVAQSARRPGKKDRAAIGRATARPESATPAHEGPGAGASSGGTSESGPSGAPSLPIVSAIEMPGVPPVGLPDLPVELPEIPVPPSLPVELPDPIGELPSLPQLPSLPKLP